MNELEITQYLADFHKIELPAVIKRDIKIPPTSKIKAIIGPRRAGKTFFLYQLMKEFKDKKQDFIFLNFENTKLFDINFKDIREIIALNNRFFKNNLESKPIVFIDEPQNIEFWERAVRELFDEEYNIFVSGSSSKLLSKEIATSLRGRSLSYNILPFSFKEFLFAKNFKHDKIPSTNEKNSIQKFLDEYLEFGGFPEVTLENDSMQKIKNLESYFELTIYKDIVERHKIKDSLLIKWILKSLISSYSKELSINKVYLTLKSHGRKISKDEIYLYYSLIEDSFFAFYLPKFSNSIRKKEPLSKIYLCDLGFTKLGLSMEDRGKKMENTVFLQLFNKKRPNTELFFWKSAQQDEVDFVIKERGNINELIQVCKEVKEEKTKKREITSLIRAGKELNCKNLLIITEDYESHENIESADTMHTIKFIPLWKWLLLN